MAAVGAGPLAPGPAPATPEAAALCGLSATDFHALLLDLLPLGAAWPRIADTVLWNFWFVPADTYAAVHASDCTLLAEAYPCGAVDLLPEWEAMVGLPDVCTQDAWPVPIAQQQALVCAKLAARGGQSRAYFIALAAAYGFTVTITEHPPWRLGRDHLCPTGGSGAIGPVGACQFWWEVTVVASGPVDPAVLTCVLQRAAPAHTVVTVKSPPHVTPEGTTDVHAAG
jgi:uncharacterized protein YmfQ (DUF2313 family)